MTMNFAEAAGMNAAFTRTENGAVALNTTGDARLDFFGTAGSLRGADKARITRLFSEAYKMDPLFATKIAFYARAFAATCPFSTEGPKVNVPFLRSTDFIRKPVICIASSAATWMEKAV